MEKMVGEKLAILSLNNVFPMNFRQSGRYSFQCTSATYYHRERDCILNLANRQISPEIFVENPLQNEADSRITYLGLMCSPRKCLLSLSLGLLLFIVTFSCCSEGDFHTRQQVAVVEWLSGGGAVDDEYDQKQHHHRRHHHHHHRHDDRSAYVRNGL